jgi:hypothetical protein
MFCHREIEIKHLEASDAEIQYSSKCYGFTFITLKRKNLFHDCKPVLRFRVYVFRKMLVKYGKIQCSFVRLYVPKVSMLNVNLLYKVVTSESSAQNEVKGQRSE